MTYEEKTTTAFRDDEKRQQMEYEKANNCKNGDGEMCMFSEVGSINCTNGYVSNIGFLYYTKEYNNTVYIYAIPREIQDYSDMIIERYLDYERNYKMKKIDGKWRIDGVCCASHNINHERCWQGFHSSL